MTKIAIIADIHHGEDRGSKRGSCAEKLVGEFLSWTETERCDLIVDLGDRISEVDPDTDFRLQSEVATWFRASKVQVRHINGNHDVDFLDSKKLAEAMGHEVHTSTMELGGYNLVFWCGSARLKYQVGIVEPSDQDLAELRQAIRSSSLPAVIFSHIPLNHPGFTGHFVHERIAPEAGAYAPEVSRKIRELLEKTEQVALCVNGHAHWNAYHTIDGIHYISVPSLTESFATYPDPNSAWSLLTLDGPDLTLKVFGKTPIEYSFPVKQPLSHHWLNVDKDYSPARITPA